MVGSIVGDCRKLGLRPEFVSVVAKRAEWPDGAKLTLNETAPACLAEGLNALGIPADKAHWVGAVGAAGMIGAHYVALRRELAAEIAKSKPEPANATPKSP